MSRGNGKNGANGHLSGEVFAPPGAVLEQARLRDWEALARRALEDPDARVKELQSLRRNVEQEDVARAALYLCSDLGRNVTGEVLHVDAGQNIMGVVSMG